MAGRDRQSGGGHITQILLQRELGGLRGRNLAVGQTPDSSRAALGSWTEQDYMFHCSGHYVEFKPVPRSTIAASFSPNGQLLASTQCVCRLQQPSLAQLSRHARLLLLGCRPYRAGGALGADAGPLSPLTRSGDHTVKVTDCFRGNCVKVLEGHTRTPWVVSAGPCLRSSSRPVRV
jgi:activator-of-BECN1-regulated-autophagy protein 1